MKIFKILFFMPLLLAAALVTGCSGDKTSADTTAPTVVSTSPVDGATLIPITTNITATFSEELDDATINDISFTVTADGELAGIGGVVSYLDLVATFNPILDLELSTEYAVVITVEATDVAGNAMEVEYTWSFTTAATNPDGVAPEVLSTVPASGALFVAVDSDITATFDEAMFSDSINDVSFTVKPDGGTTNIAGAVSYAAMVATFNPTADLALNTEYTATITVEVTDVSGQPMALEYMWSFTTTDGVGQLPVELGAASTFAVFAHQVGISNAITSVITGNVGLDIDAATNITGLTCGEVTGTIYAFDASNVILGCEVVDTVLLNNVSAATLAAYGDATAVSRGTPTAIAGDLNGTTLYPGLYEGNGLSISAAGTLTLDALGDANAVFIIRSTDTITTLANSNLILAGDAKATNIYWVAATAVTLGTSSIMKGTIIASTAITVGALANLEGRILTWGPAAALITIDSSTITIPAP